MNRRSRTSVPILMWLVVAACGPTARAASLTLNTDAPTENPLVITPLDASRQLLVRVVNAVADDPPAEYLSGWQFRLRIVPDPTAAGTLQFNSGVEPGNYIFPAGQHFDPVPVANFGNELAALDSASPPSAAVPVPTAPGTNLLTISFAPSTDAIGTFGIYALGTGTLWSDANIRGRAFVNVPFGDTSVRIASVLVTSVADYNRDGTVDAADYTVWRDGLGTKFSPADYNVWKQHFGESAGSGSAATGSANAGGVSTIPEPASMVLLIAVGLLVSESRLATLQSAERDRR